MKLYKSVFIFSLINSISITNISAFGVEAGMASNEADTTTIAEDKKIEVVSDTPTRTEASAATPLSGMESEHIGNPESIEAGGSKYGNTCLFCHGPKGIGSRAPTLVSKGFAPGGANDNEFFFTTITYGRPGTIMGAYEGTLTETEMWQVIAYLRDQAEKVAAAKK